MTQNDRIMRYLREEGSITQLDALQYLGVYRLASRISDLRKEGVNIKREMVKSINRYGEPMRYAKYTLIKEE